MHFTVEELYNSQSDELFHVTIRSAVPEDAEAIIALIQRVCAQTEFLLFAPEEVDTDIERERRIIEETAVNRQRALLVADIDDELVGFAGFSPAAPGQRAAHRVRMAMAVDKDHWSKSIGTHLINMLLLEAYYRDIEFVELGVDAENKRAAGFYGSIGFTEWGRCPCASRHGDTYHDEIEMSFDIKKGFPE